MALSVSTSDTSVGGLLGERSPRRGAPGGRAPAEIGSWAAKDSRLAAACAPGSCCSPSESEGDGGVYQLRIEVATNQLSEAQARVRSLEAEARELRARLSTAEGRDEGTKLSQAVLVQRVQELESALADSKAAEQRQAAQLARAEGRVAVAEGCLQASESQLGQGLTELQAQHAAALDAARAAHARELASARGAAEQAAAAARAAADAREAKLAAANAAVEASLRREQARARELQAQLDKQGSKQEAVRELLRHSESVQSQLDRLQTAAQEERRRAGRAAAAAEAALRQERQLGEAAVQEAQQREQEASREHDKALRQVRAKLQRAETELRAAKQQAATAGARAAEMEGINSQKDLQLDAAVQQVSMMQHELEALRLGLSGRQAAAIEAARSEYAAALAGCQADLVAAQQRASEQALVVQRQGQALASILSILSVHAGEHPPAAGPKQQGSGGGAGAAPTSAAGAAAPDPDKVVAFVEAVSGSMLDVAQVWELEKGELASALEAAEAVHCQLESLLERERGENREMTAEGAEMRGALGELEEQLKAAHEQLHQLEAAQTARAAADSALEACRSQLAAATAKAASAADDAAKWQGTASALEAQVQKLAAAADEAQKQAQSATEEAQAKEGRIEEMRSAMAGAMRERSNSVSELSGQLAQVQAACSAACPAAVQQLQNARAALAGEGEPQAAAVTAALQAAARMLQEMPPAEQDLAGCVGSLGSAVSQLAAGYSHVAAMVQERHKVHHILSSVNARLQQAAAAHPSRLQGAGAAPALLAAGSPNGIGAGASASASSLVDLLQQLTENVVGLIEGLAVEKECLESQMLHSTDEAQQLRSQLHSVESVLEQLQSHTALEHREALVALEQARLHVAELAAENAELAQRAQQAQAAADTVRVSATHEWSSMRDDLSSLVQQAEQAQMDADSACQRQREEYEARLAHVQQQAAEGVAGREAAEQGAQQAQRELAATRQELEALERRLAEQEAGVRAGLAASQARVAELEGQVAQLQRQLAARLRGKGVSAAPAKKVAAASGAAVLLKKENGRLRAQVEGLQEQVRLLDTHVRQGVQQLRAAKELAAAAERGIADAEGRATRAETLLRKVDERKAAAEVERRRASGAASRLEQQVLELQSRLEAAQHRERSAQAEVERLRATGSKRDGDARQLSAALSQLEVAEAALRDSQGTASRLLQDCTNLQRSNCQLCEQERRLNQQLQDSLQEAAAAGDQVEDLQATLDSVITELDIARSLLANQRHQEAQALEGREQGPPPGELVFHQRLVAFPVRLGSLQYVPEADPGQGRPRSALEQAMDVLASKDTNARGSSGGGAKGGADGTAYSTPRATSSAEVPSPLTQQASMQRPGTPSGTHLGATPGPGARLTDDGSSGWDVPVGAQAGKTSGTSAMPVAGSSCQQQHGGAARGPASRPGSGLSRPDTAASSAAMVDVSNVRRLVATVEGLQRQLSVKNDRIKQMRAALETASANGASFTPVGSRPGSAATNSGSSDDVRVLQQRLEAAQEQVETLRALSANLERQLSDAQQAQQQVAGAARQLAALLPASSIGASSRPGSAGSRPSTSGDAGGVLRLQAHQLAHLAGQLGSELESSRRELLGAQQQANTLTLQLASRNALVDALQARLRTVGGAGSCGTAAGSGVTEGTQTDAATLLAAPAPLAATAALQQGTTEGAAAADALGSLDRIVGLWRQACSAKDGQLLQLQQELEQAQDSLNHTRSELEGASAAVQQLSEQQQESSGVIRELQELLEAAEQRMMAAREEEQALTVRCTECEAAMLEAQAAAEADAGAAQEAHAAAGLAQQQAHRLQQQLDIAEAQVRELQHAVQLEKLGHADVDALRQQAASLKADLAGARQEAVAAARQVGDLQEQLRQQKVATAAAADGSASGLAARLDAARQAEQLLLRQVQDLQAEVAGAERQSEEGRRAAAVAEAQVRQLQERLAASEQQHREALEAVEQQSAALEGLQAALDGMQVQQRGAAEAAGKQQQLAGQVAALQAQLAGAQAQLTQAQQVAAVAEKQAEVCRSQAAKAETEAARALAERRHVASREAAVADALQRYQRGVAVLSSTLQQLQASGGGEGAEELLLASLTAGASGGPGSSGMAVEQMVDEILLQVHRRDCEISSLVAQLAHLEAAIATKGRQTVEAEAKQQQSQASLSRLKEQLHWSSKEADALKRQLGDQEAQLRQLRTASIAGASSWGAGAAAAPPSWPQGGYSALGGASSSGMGAAGRDPVGSTMSSSAAGRRV